MKERRARSGVPGEREEDGEDTDSGLDGRHVGGRVRLLQGVLRHDCVLRWKTWTSRSAPPMSPQAPRFSRSSAKAATPAAKKATARRSQAKARLAVTDALEGPLRRRRHARLRPGQDQRRRHGNPAGLRPHHRRRSPVDKGDSPFFERVNLLRLVVTAEAVGDAQDQSKQSGASDFDYLRHGRARVPEDAPAATRHLRRLGTRQPINFDIPLRPLHVGLHLRNRVGDLRPEDGLLRVGQARRDDCLSSPSRAGSSPADSRRGYTTRPGGSCHQSCSRRSARHRRLRCSRVEPCAPCPTCGRVVVNVS